MGNDSKARNVALEKLREDWLGENSDSREEDATKWQLNNQCQNAKARSQRTPDDVDLLFDLASAYGILDPCDKRCLNVLERMMNDNGVNTLDTQRKGEAYQLFGRSLFFAHRFEESLAALQKAQICFKDKGNFTLRRQNNRAMLRVFCALGRGKEASERLEVALTLCENSDDCIFLYISAKQALEYTGCERDKEILDDIWYVHLDTHPEEKAKFLSHQQASENLCRKFAGGEERPDSGASWAEMWERAKDPNVWREILPLVVKDMKENPIMRTVCLIAGYLLFICIALLVMLRFKYQGPPSSR